MLKRGFDFALALGGLVMLSPVIGAAAVAVRLSSPGPSFYGGPRVGRDGRVFRIHKLRSMRVEQDPAATAVTASDDARITGVGRVLRRTKLDELPQLWNVVKGDMSLVGPRPEHPKFVERYTPEQRRVLSVRPGITGPAALAYVDEEQMLAGGDAERTYVERVMPEKLAIDLRYVETARFRTDVGILLRTVGAVARRRRAAG